MLRIQFSNEEAKKLDDLRFTYPDPKIQGRFEVVWLKSLGYPHHEIATIAGIHHDTVKSYLNLYRNGGIEPLAITNYRKPPGSLDNHRTSIKEKLHNNPPQTIKEACSRIHKLTGILRKATQIRTFIKQLGFRRIKAAQIPAKADPIKQEGFLNTLLNPKIEEAKNGLRAVLFLNSAHFVHAIILGMLWCLERVFVKSSSGRSRFNVLGAIDVMTQKLHLVTNTTYINSESVCIMLKKIALYYGGMPITIVLDNARYQKCPAVTLCAEELGIELLYLPTYSPNLKLFLC